MAVLSLPDPPSAGAYGLGKKPPPPPTLFGREVFGSSAKPKSFNLEKARALGEARREEKAEEEQPGELVELPSGLKYREIDVGTKVRPQICASLPRHLRQGLSSGIAGLDDCLCVPLTHAGG